MNEQGRRSALAGQPGRHGGTNSGEANLTPGKQTLVGQLDAGHATMNSSAEQREPDVRVAAAQGTAGPSQPLPFAGLIQRAFGRHDVSAIQAHTGPAAAAGAQALGAQAFAAGQHVAFGSTPDLHTAAHEAAHVVQQRGGIQLKGGIGEAGDVHEVHANRVADRVVAGSSAEDLLDQYVGAGTGSSHAAMAHSGSAAVQLQPTGPSTGSPPGAGGASPSPAGSEPTSPASGTPNSPPPEAAQAPTRTRNPNAPPARNADWTNVQTAATDQDGQTSLDIAWIEGLPSALKDSIDQGFADTVAQKAVEHAIPVDGKINEIKKEVAKKLKDLRASAIERLAAADPSLRRKPARQVEALLAADDAYVTAKNQLEHDREARIAARSNEITQAADGPMSAGSREDSVVSPPGGKITRLEGKALARTNFMSWAVDVLGSTAAAKQHFESIRHVSRQSGMFLIDKAATRFEAARAEFEAKQPGYTFPSTSVALGLRGFHQARQGIGMLGHALGVAFDLRANDNPNQKLVNPANYGYMLDRFGGSGDTRGRSVMTLGVGGEDKISQLGRDTEARRTTAEGEALVATIRTQFEEMAATSDRFRASMADHLPELSEARDSHFNGLELDKESAQASKDLANGDKIADERLKDEKFSGTAAEKAARRDEIKAELRAKRDELQRAAARAKTVATNQMEHAFADWVAKIDADIAKVLERKAQSDAELAVQAKAKQDLDAIDIRAAGANELLSTYADAHQLRKPRQIPRADIYKNQLKAQLAAKQKARPDTDPLSPAYIRSELAVLNRWQEVLKDPKLVFGQGYVEAQAAPTTGAGSAPGNPPTSSVAVNSQPAVGAAPATTAPAANPATAASPPAKHWGTKMEATNVPVMQLLEHGFVRNDDMPTRPPGGALREVFNADVVTTLARHGFSPGATYRDTMHFDFIEGYAAAPGGRSQANMNKTKFGPTGDIPASTPQPAQTRGH